MGRHDDLPLTPLSLAILLALLEGELHGYGIIKTVEAQSSGRFGRVQAACMRCSTG